MTASRGQRDNTADEAARLAASGVDGVFTDRLQAV